MLKSQLCNWFQVPQQWQNLVNHCKICQVDGNGLRDSITGSFPVNNWAALEIAALKILLEEFSEWLVTNGAG